MTIRNEDIWPELEEALNLPDNMKVVSFNLELKVNTLPVITMGIRVEEDVANEIATVLKRYQLIEEENNDDSPNGTKKLLVGVS